MIIQSKLNLKGNIKSSVLCIIEMPQGKRKNNKRKLIFEEISAKNFPKLMPFNISQNPEAPFTQNCNVN